MANEISSIKTLDNEIHPLKDSSARTAISAINAVQGLLSGDGAGNFQRAPDMLPATATVNGKALSANPCLSASDVGASRTFIKDPGADGYRAGAQADLSVIKLTNEEYAELLYSEDVQPNALYVISDDYVNSYGKQIKNVAQATGLSDAVPLWQLSGMMAAGLSGCYAKSETSSASQLQTAFAGKLAPADVKLSYHDDVKKIVLSSGTQTTSVDCADFIKDGMLSSVELCSSRLVFRFNTDASAMPISVALSDFIDETQYWKKTETSSAVQLGTALQAKRGLFDIAVYEDKYTDWEFSDGQSHEIIIAYDPSMDPDCPWAIYFADGIGTPYTYFETEAAARSCLEFEAPDHNSEIVVATRQRIGVISAENDRLALSSDLFGYYPRSETSSASQVSAALSSKAELSDLTALDYSRAVISSGGVSSKVDDLVINSVTKAQYDAMLSAGTLADGQLYSVDSLQLDARNDWVVNVKAPELSSDAANKAYVDSQLSAAAGGYAFDMYYPPFDSVNNMYVLKPGKFNILSSAVTDGCVLVLEDYDEDKIYKVKLSCDPANAAHISLLADDNSATESPGAYSVSKLNGKVDWLSPSQIYRFEVSYGNVTVNDDYNGDSLVTLRPFETQTEPIDQYDPGETLYHLLPVDNAVNYLSALTGNRTYNLHMPPVQTVNGVRRMRQFKIVPSSAGFGEVGAQLSILNRDIENKLVSFRYKTDRVHACAPLSGEALVFEENKNGTFDVFFENELELDSAKIAAIDGLVTERATTIWFDDGTVSSFNWAGRISQQTMRDAGLYVTERAEGSGDEWDAWAKNPIRVKIGSAVTRIGTQSFYNASSLSAAEIPEGVDRISEESFWQCCTLGGVTIPSSVSAVGENAFKYCEILSSVTVVGKTQEQAEALLSGAGLADGCIISTWNAASLEQLSGLEQLSSKQDKLADAQLSDINYIPHLKPENTVVVFTDDTVSSFNVGYINSNTVQSWGKEPKSIKIGTNCTYVVGGFKDKTSLTSITFAEERTTELTVRYEAFRNTGITSIVIPEFVKFQDYGNLHYQFSYCQNLKEVIYKCSSINNTFKYSPNLTSIAFTDNLKYIGSTIFYGSQNLKYISIPNSVTAIEKSAFQGNAGLTSIVLPEKIHDIKDSVFSGCSSLTGIAIPPEVSSIYANAFYGCFSLTSIDIPDSVKRIGVDTVMPTNQGKPFGNCVNLSNVTVGTGVTDIISNAFDNCANLTSIVFRNRLSSEIPSGAPWGAINATITTWNDASREWVEEKLGDIEAILSSL